MAYFSRILALLDRGEWGFWWGQCQCSAWRFFGGDIRVAAYRIAIEETQKLRYFASA